MSEEPARSSNRRKIVINYRALLANNGPASRARDYYSTLVQGYINTCPETPVRHLEADDLKLELFANGDFVVPFALRNSQPHGLMIPADFSLERAVDLLGADFPVNAMDVLSQEQAVPELSISEWAAYLATPEEDRNKLLNVISLEFSGTPLCQGVRSPDIVRQLDWTETQWPRTDQGQFVDGRPTVQHYLLTGPKHAFTDFHIDFAGTSVWYHVVKGAKTFIFLPPTTTNLTRFERWSQSPDQADTFFGQHGEQLTTFTLRAGQTMMIPSGWIHAVLTAEDALVIGGNFLHSFAITSQLSTFSFETRTKVRPKFRFPNFKQLNWYVAASYWRLIQSPEQISSLLDTERLGVRDLVTTLFAWAREKAPPALPDGLTVDVLLKDLADAFNVHRAVKVTVRMTEGTSEASVSGKLKLRLPQSKMSAAADGSTVKIGLEKVERERSPPVYLQDDFMDYLEKAAGENPEDEIAYNDYKEPPAEGEVDGGAQLELEEKDDPTYDVYRDDTNDDDYHSEPDSPRSNKRKAQKPAFGAPSPKKKAVPAKKSATTEEPARALSKPVARNHLFANRFKKRK